MKRDNGLRHVNVTQLCATWRSEIRQRARRASHWATPPPYSCELVSYAWRTPGRFGAHIQRRRRIVLIADPLNDRWTDRLGTRVFTATPSFTKMHVNSDACTGACYGAVRCARGKSLAVDIRALLFYFSKTWQWLSVRRLLSVWVVVTIFRLKKDYFY